MVFAFRQRCGTRCGSRLHRALRKITLGSENDFIISPISVCLLLINRLSPHSSINAPILIMIFLLSPAKTLDFSPIASPVPHTECRFLAQSADLISQIRLLTPNDLSALMGISPQLAQLNYARFQSWQMPFSDDDAKQALLAFMGDVYTGLGATGLDDASFRYAAANIRILSGLYGLLRPTDRILPYRLEMGTAFANTKGDNLYQFWGETISNALRDDLARNDAVLINLASKEYYKSVKPRLLNARIITPEFKDEKNGAFKVISFYAKKARGMMCRYAAEHKITAPDDLKQFDREGYFYSEDDSTADKWVFKRFEHNSPAM